MYSSAKEFLLQYQRSQERIKQLSDRLEQLRQTTSVKATKIAAEGYVRGSAQVSDLTGTQAVRIADMSDKLIDAKLKMIETMEIVADVIDKVPDAEQSRVLFDRFIRGQPWDMIAKNLELNPAHVRGRLYMKALEAVSIIIDNKTNFARAQD